MTHCIVHLFKNWAITTLEPLAIRCKGLNTSTHITVSVWPLSIWQSQVSVSNTLISSLFVATAMWESDGPKYLISRMSSLYPTNFESRNISVIKFYIFKTKAFYFDNFHKKIKKIYFVTRKNNSTCFLTSMSSALHIMMLWSNVTRLMVSSFSLYDTSTNAWRPSASSCASLLFNTLSYLCVNTQCEVVGFQIFNAPEDFKHEDIVFVKCPYLLY